VADSEPSSYPPHYPHDGSYADLLAWHLEYWGTRPTASTTVNGEPWSKAEFCLAIYSVDHQDSARTNLHNWLGAKGAPDETRHSLIQEELFGNNVAFQRWRIDLENARKRSPKGKNQRTRQFPDPPPAIKLEASIPRLSAHFMGRDEEVNQLASLLSSIDGPSAILVQGGPGIGKTEFTKAAAHHSKVVNRFGTCRFYIPLENTTTVATMERQIAEAIGCDQARGLSAFLEILKATQTLLILDGFETPLGADRKAAAELLAKLADVATIVISMRGRQQIRGLPSVHECVLQPLSEASSIDLFAAIAGKWVLDDYDLDDTIERLDGIPLAIELIAHRARSLSSLEPLMVEWFQVGSEFVRDPDAEENRQTSLSYSIELSLDRLDAEEGDDPALLLFGLLGVLPDGLARYDIWGLIGRDAFTGTEDLLRTGLAFEREGRVLMLQPIRDHARQHYKLVDYKNNWWANYFVEQLEIKSILLQNNPTSTEIYIYIFENYFNFHRSFSKKRNENDETDRMNRAENMLGEHHCRVMELQKNGDLDGDFDMGKYNPWKRINFHRRRLKEPMLIRALRRAGIKFPRD
jgi:hypothetical protein